MQHIATIKALTEKRTDLNDQLDKHQAAVRQIIQDIDHVDATLKLFGIEKDRDKVLRQSYRGEVAKIILGAIRDARRGLTSEELAQRVLIERHSNPDDKKLVANIIKRIRGCLQHYRRKGVVVSRENDAGFLEWSVA